MNKPDDDEPFLSRWSRMKQRAVRPSVPTEAVPDEQAERDQHAINQQATAPPDGVPAVADATPTKDGEPEPPLDLEKLPRVEELTAESDIAGFLDHRVPAALRNAALSRMWTLDPTIRDFIEVAENQWNWNIPGGAPFYEVIEEGSTAGMSFADATSAISRSLTSTGEAPPEAEISANQPIEISDQQKVESAMESNVAPQQEPPAAPPSSVSRSSPLPHSLQDVAGAEADLVAVQQISPPVRRRHGGALPA